jgi:chromate transporter
MSRHLLINMAMMFATTAIVSVGGIAAMIPEIHRQAVDVYGWMDNETFATTFALSQIAPGPNILLMSLIGWRIAGFPGLAVATLATVAPTSLIALGAGRVERRLENAEWYKLLRRSLPPIVVGLIIASGAVTARASITGVAGVVIAAAVAFFVFLRKTNPLLPLSLAIVVGVALGRLGLL